MVRLSPECFAPGDVGELFRSFFGEFQFDGIEVEDGKVTVEFTPSHPDARDATSLPILCGVEVTLEPEPEIMLGQR